MRWIGVALAWAVSAVFVVMGMVLLIRTEAEFAGLVSLGLGTSLFIVTMGLVPSKERAGPNQRAERTG